MKSYDREIELSFGIIVHQSMFDNYRKSYKKMYI